MWIKMRLFLVGLLVGAFLVQTSLSHVSTASAAVMMTMQDDCCPIDCPDLPECDAACVSTMQCRAVSSVQSKKLAVLEFFPTSKIAVFLTVGLTDSLQYMDNGLRRPPKA
jgi:hypothetical protein